MFLLEIGRGFLNVPGGDDDADVFRDLFLGSAGECIKVSVVGVKRAVGTGGGEAGMGGRGSEQGPAGADVYCGPLAGAAADAFDESRDNGALGLEVRELLGVEFVRHLSFHLLSVFLIPVLSFVALVDSEAVSMSAVLHCSLTTRLVQELIFKAMYPFRVIVHAMEQEAFHVGRGARRHAPLLSQRPVPRTGGPGALD